MGHYLWLTFYKLRDSFRPLAAMACESMEEILLRQVKKEEDLNVQTAETIDKTPILSTYLKYCSKQHFYKKIKTMMTKSTVS